ncbi:hypothetical protein E5676_scaffold22G00590 [Cucumis melo var. makuwa]|uniref:Uncharacterized protein n=1 Tax=Cucumis melo var. makuwa TaxID=1194695 RepID=A0A5A7UM54_CUCMM|nr:hypothetical protein E6C27_scaffold24G004240 [Cucumis melo var. makuwa]TYK27583.1 hypothetical protein E5676_scaffold22G00590 [Cucumis melo var. makuwa]
MQDWRLYQCFTNFEDCIVTLPCPSSRVTSMHPHIQARSSKTSSTLPHIQARRLHRRFLIYAALPPLQNVDAKYSTSSQICCSREDCHLPYVTAEKIFISNRLQLRRSLSQICCSQEDLHLQYVTVEKVVISNMLRSREAEKVLISIMLHREDHSSPMCWSFEHDNDSTSRPQTLQMITVQLREDDDGAALPLPLQDDNNGANSFPPL